MALKEYKPGTTFTGRVERTVGESEPAWPAPLRAKEGAPNVLFPGYNGNVPFENGFLSEMLLQRGYNTYAVGSRLASGAG